MSKMDWRRARLAGRRTTDIRDDASNAARVGWRATTDRARRAWS